MVRQAVLSGCVVAIFTASQGIAQTTFDTIFREGTLAGMPPGTVLSYDHDTANLALADPERQQSSVALKLELTEDGSAVVSESTETGQRPLGGFDASVGNPLAMVFLESAIRNMAEATGGSPFYIRNRLKESMVGDAPIEAVEVTVDDATVAAKQVTLTPFARDGNRNRMGEFADLTIEVTVSEEAPGYYVALTAETPETNGYRTYSERFALEDFAEGSER